MLPLAYNLFAVPGSLCLVLLGFWVGLVCMGKIKWCPWSSYQLSSQPFIFHPTVAQLSYQILPPGDVPTSKVCMLLVPAVEKEWIQCGKYPSSPCYRLPV